MGLDGRLLATDVTALSSAFQDADAGFLVPSCASEDFVPAMLELCQRESVRLVVPTIDTELPAYAANRDRFAAIGTTVAVSSPAVIAIGADKVRTYAWLVDAGLSTVRQTGVAEVLADPGSWAFPLLVKPRSGSSGKGVAVVADLVELEVATRAGDFVVQTIAPGVEHTVDLLVDRGGRCRCAVPRRRLEVRAGEVSKGVTVDHRAVGALALRAAESLPGAYGVLNLQVFASEDDELTVIELNPRFGGGFPLAWQAGADYPRWLVEEVLGHPSSARADGWRSGVVMLRYDDAIFVEADRAGL